MNIFRIFGKNYESNIKKRIYLFGNLWQSAANLMLDNSRATSYGHITPSWPHYQFQWFWDSSFHSIICSYLSRLYSRQLKRIARKEIISLMNYQKKNGFIPHEIFHGEERPLDFERFTFTDRAFHSNYTQPPVLALSFAALDDYNFLNQYWDQLIAFYDYFWNTRREKGLISIIHPCESGRDIDPSLSILSCQRHLGGFLWGINLPYRVMKWDITEIRNSRIYWVKDVMFNAIYVNALKVLEGLSNDPQEKAKLRKRANRVEKAMTELMWNEKNSYFYNLDNNMKQIESVSISSLFGLLLPNIPKEIVERLVQHIINPLEFWTCLPLPSIPINHPNFKADYRWGMPPWNGPVWMNMNWYIVQGLLIQAKRFKSFNYFKIAQEIVRKSLGVVQEYGFWEVYHPWLGKGMRVQNFGWSALMITLEWLIDDRKTSREIFEKILKSESKWFFPGFKKYRYN